MSLLKIGLTGGIGCGKSTAVNAFRVLGAAIIDADQIAKDLVKAGSPALIEIARVFGRDILLSSGELNRAALKKKVFSDSRALDQLENIIHPGVRAEISQQLKVLAGSPYVIADIPLLIEKHYEDLFDRIIVVDCLPEQQISRVTQRDKMDEATLNAIIKKQVNRETRLKAATDILDNSGDIKMLTDQIEKLHNKYVHLNIYIKDNKNPIE